MPIEFNCPACQRKYRVKDELAGKTAKCGKCSHRMQIPLAAPPDIPDLADLDAGPGSWADDELQAPAPVAAKPAAPPSMCKECGAPMAGDAIVCLLCGFDKRTGKVRAIKAAKDDGRPGSSGVASLLRGTCFSLMGAMLGAVIWAVVAYLTERQFGIIAWALGGLAGAGMAFGHEDDDGTTAGIIAAFVSLGGIVGAKILIVVIVVAAAMANQRADFEAINPADVQRTVLAVQMAGESVKGQGIDLANATDDQWRQASAAARAEVDKMSQDEVTARLAKYQEAQEAAEAEEAKKPRLQEVDQPADVPDIAQPPDGGQENPGPVALFFKLMFSPIDGLFILLAFFTAYRVGSGSATN